MGLNQAGSRRSARIARLGLSSVPCLMLAACGGAGGSSPVVTPPPIITPAPSPTPSPGPSPTPSPTPSSYDTSEYRATVGAVSMNALAAYNRSATGAGVGVAVIDTGIDTRSDQFAGRIAASSASVSGTDGIADQSGHGTAVAFTIAGRRDGQGTQGVAFDSSLIVLRADRPGSCAAGAGANGDSGCKFGTDAIARGVDAARMAGARVINISLGGSDMPANLQAAIARATAAGIVLVMAAGNDGAANPDAFSAIANNAAVARNQVIIAGWVDSRDQIAERSNRAGSAAAHYLSAMGSNVRAPDQNGIDYLWSGTSFAAPQISGAVALLAQAFPNLSGAQIVELLFRTARDAGAAGVDGIYGQGVLDLTRAFQPVGTSSVAGSTAAVSLTANGTLSAVMGDAAQTGLGAVILDGYSRAFAIDLARTLAHARPQPALANALGLGGRSVAVARGETSLSMTLSARASGDAILQRSALSAGDASRARVLAGLVTQRMGPDLSVGLGFAQGAQAVTTSLTGMGEPGFLIAGATLPGIDGGARQSAAVRQRLGGWGMTGAIESGRMLAPGTLPWAEGDRAGMGGYDRALFALDRRFGALATMITATRLHEDDTILGARLGPGLGATRATSWFGEASARVDAGGGWSLGGRWRQGWTIAAVRGGMRGGGHIRTTAFAADLGKDGVFGGDSFGLRIAQPLRVAGGGVDLALPTGYDYARGAVTDWTVQRLNMAPRGRELDVEARYAVGLGIGWLEANAFHRRDPGHIAALPADTGVALRYGFGF